MSLTTDGALPASAQPSLAAWTRRNLPVLVLLGLLAVLPLLVPAFFVGVATRAMIYGLAAAAVGFVIVHGGMISFGHAAYFGAGAYVVLLLQLAGVREALLSWPAAAIVGGLLAAGFGALSLRTRGVYFIMITLCFAQMLFFIASSTQMLGAVDGRKLDGRDTLLGLPIGSTVVFHYICLCVLAAGLALLAALSRSGYGLALRGIRDNERRMRAIGYRTTRTMLSAFTLSGAVCGLAGAMLANYYLFVSPSYLHWLVSGELLVMAVLGGMASPAGPLLGALVLVGAELALSSLTTYWRIILGPAVILAVLYLRRGLLDGLLSALRRKGEHG